MTLERSASVTAAGRPPLLRSRTETENLRKSVRGGTKSKLGPSNGVREIQLVKDMMTQMQSLAVFQKRENLVRGLKDLKDIKESTLSMKKTRDMAILRAEALACVINPVERRRLMKSSILVLLTAEKELQTVVFKRRDEFAEYIWKKRMAARGEIRNLFQGCSFTIAKFGDVLSEASLQMALLFETNTLAQLCKAAIHSGLADNDDLRSFFVKRISLSYPKLFGLNIFVEPNRVTFGHKAPPAVDPLWGSAYGTGGPWMARLSAKPLQRDLVIQTYKQIHAHSRSTLPVSVGTAADVGNVVSTYQWTRRKSMFGGPQQMFVGLPPPLPTAGSATGTSLDDTGSIDSTRTSVQPSAVEILRQTSAVSTHSYSRVIARVVDAVHPTHQLSSHLLTFPAYAGHILRKRLVQLGYDVPGGKDGETGSSISTAMDAGTALVVLAQMDAKLGKETKFYLEFSIGLNTHWRAGVITCRSSSESKSSAFPGDTDESFGFGSDGTVWTKNESRKYTDPETTRGMRTFGLLLDMYLGSLHLVIDGKILPAGFGTGATAYTEEERAAQRDIIQGFLLIPMFAVRGLEDRPGQNATQKEPRMKINFGANQMTFTVQALTFDHSLHYTSSRGDSAAVELQDKSSQEEEEKIEMAVEQTTFMNLMKPELLKSFSQFPPSIYRRSFAATVIQKAWRRYRARKTRQKLRSNQHQAAIIIQRAVIRFLRRLHAVKNPAAAVIQKAWLHTCYLRIMLFSVRYGQHLKELHRAATKIQRVYRRWYLYRNSPIAARYKRKVTDIINAAIKIQRWWRPLLVIVLEKRREQKRENCATKIQSLWRGYRFRKKLRPDMWKKFHDLGAIFLAKRKVILREPAASTIQKAWRAYRTRKYRQIKVQTRNKAAAKIQALWRGYQTRTHITLTLNYGQNLFLSAVRSGLRKCHFLVRMYRPCGIVCPKDDLPLVPTTRPTAKKTVIIKKTE